MRIALAVLVLLLASSSWSEDWLQKYKDLNSKSPAELRLLRNEIFARHGRVFKSPDLQEYFQKEPWYKPNPGYSDSMLSQQERELVRSITQIEQGQKPKQTISAIQRESDPFLVPQMDEGWKHYFERVFERSQRVVKANQGIPDSIGGISLGEKVSPPIDLVNFQKFIELEGQLYPTYDAEGRVSALSLTFSFPFASDGDGPKLVAIIAKMVGSAPTQEHGNFVWRAGVRVLRFETQPEDMTEEYTVIIHSSAPELPGNPKDGFKEFLETFSVAIREKSPSTLDRFFNFPLFDDAHGTEVAGELACSNSEEFKKKFGEIEEVLGIEDEPAATPSTKFEWPDTYHIYLGTKGMTVKKVDGRWKITRFEYQL